MKLVSKHIYKILISLYLTLKLCEVTKNALSNFIFRIFLSKSRAQLIKFTRDV